MSSIRWRNCLQTRAVEWRAAANPTPFTPPVPGYGGAGAAGNLQAQGYNVIYPSGSLGDLASQLDYWREWRPDILRWAAAILIFALFAWIIVDYFDFFDSCLNRASRVSG